MGRESDGFEERINKKLKNKRPMYCKHLIRVLLFILPFFVAGGCTKEDTSDCRTAVRLQLSYTHNKEGRDLFKEVATCGDILLYNGDGTLLERRAMTAQEYETATLQLMVPLEKASYTVVFWANLLTENYVLDSEATMQSMRMSLQHEQGQVSGVLPDLLHGVSSFATDGQRTPIEQTLSMRNLTNQVNVILEGAMSGTRAAGTAYSMQLTGSNGLYGWAADNFPGESLNYVPIYTPNIAGYDKALCGTFHTLHLWPGSDLRLMIFNGSSVLYDEPLVDLLMQSPDINTEDDLWRYSDYYLRFDSNMMLTAIKVLEWHDIDTEGGL